VSQLVWGSSVRPLTPFLSHRARRRIARQKEEAKLPLSKIIDTRKQSYSQLKVRSQAGGQQRMAPTANSCWLFSTQKFTQLGSQIGDDRPVSLVRFSPNSKLLLTGSWTGNARVWDMPSCNLKTTYRGHGDRVGGVAWHPQATLSQSEDAVNFVTGAADGLVKLWSLGR